MSNPAEVNFERRITARTRTLVEHTVLSLMNAYQSMSRPVEELDVLKRVRDEVNARIARLEEKGK